MLDIGSDHELERYRYPGGFVAQTGASDAETGKHLSKVIMEAEEASHLRYRGDSQIRTLAPVVRRPAELDYFRRAPASAGRGEALEGAFHHPPVRAGRPEAHHV